MPNDHVTFTVFTPTFNRAHVLHRVHDSLVAQTYSDFEWLIIDNASDDGTEALVEGWMVEARIPIRYLRNPTNIGRQGSWRRAIAEARGELFLELRSADGMRPEALERFKFHWDAIPANDRHRFSAVTGLCVDEHGDVLGSEFPHPVIDSNSIEIRERYRVRGEKFGFQRTDVLRRTPIPLIPGYTGSVPESLVWRSIARRYQTRYVNEPLRIYWQDQGFGLSRPTEPWRNAPGRLLDSQDRLNNDLRGWFNSAPLGFFRDAVAYVASSLHLGLTLAQQAAGLNGAGARALWIAGLPVGTLLYLIQRYLPRLARRLVNP